MSKLDDPILTFIERREAEQIQYGLYDVLLTGDEVLSAFPSELEQDVRAALEELQACGLIIRFEDQADHRAWIFRSRITETVRLVSKLRQRISDSERALLKARADRSPRLVHDLKFEVQRRYAPARDLPMADLVAPLRTHHPEAAHILEALFPAAEFQFSGFQQRAFQAIADHILLRPQRGNVRGTVVTASTGAGKTYAFFLPVLAHCLVEKGLRGQVGALYGSSNLTPSGAELNAEFNRYVSDARTVAQLRAEARSIFEGARALR